MLKLYPEIILHALDRNKPVGGVRLWFLAKHYDRGNGNLPAKKFTRWLVELGVPRSTVYRWLDQALGLGLIEQKEGVYSLVSWDKGALIVGVSHLSRPVKIDHKKFINKGWLNWVWDAYLIRYKGKPIARQTLQALTGTPPRTQLEREKKVGTRKKENYADLGSPQKDPQTAVYPDKQLGYYGAHGRIRRRLPNSYESVGSEQANTGRTKQVNKRIKQALCLSWDSSRTDRFYCRTYPQFKQAARHNSTTAGLYLFITDRIGVNLWQGMTV